MSRRQEETVAYGSPDSPLSKMDVISVGKWMQRLYIIYTCCHTGFNTTEPFKNSLQIQFIWIYTKT